MRTLSQFEKTFYIISVIKPYVFLLLGVFYVCFGLVDKYGLRY